MRVLIFILLTLCITSVYGQEFEYKQLTENTVKITAKRETFSKVGKIQPQHVSFSSEYWMPILGEKHNSYLTKEQLQLLKEYPLGWRVNVIFTYKGDIESVRFYIKKEVLKHISIDTLRQLYNAYRATKIDVSKGNIDPPLDDKMYASMHFFLK